MPKPGGPLRYSPEFVVLAKNMRKQKLPLFVIARSFGVTERTIWRWRRKYKDFGRKIKVADAVTFRGIVSR